jgi:hypothetical protein
MALITLIGFKAKKLCLCKEAFTSLFVVLEFYSLSTEFLKIFVNGATAFTKTTISRTKICKKEVSWCLYCSAISHSENVVQLNVVAPRTWYRIHNTPFSS